MCCLGVSFPIRGRVWVHHLNFSSGHRQNGDRWLQPWLIAVPAVAFFLPLICIHKQTIKNWVSHCWNGDQQWPELKLRWWTQTLPRLYRIHLSCYSHLVFGPLYWLILRSFLAPGLLMKSTNIGITMYNIRLKPNPQARWVNFLV